MARRVEPLEIEFCGEEHRVAARAGLSFGRDADLVVDTNPYLHRVAGRFVHRDGHWWLDNSGRSVAMVVRRLDGTGTATLGPGGSLALAPGAFLCTFSAGGRSYELSGTVPGPALPAVAAVPDGDGDGSDGPGGPVPLRTLEWGRVELNEDQVHLLVVLCEEGLRNPWQRPAPVPTNRAAAVRLGWTLPKFNRKLDHLCQKLARAGVAGLHGDLGLLAADRRRRLVDHALDVGLVGEADLGRLDESDPGRASA